MAARDISPEDLAAAEALESALWAEFMAPPPTLTVTQWAEKNRVLSGKDSAEPGPYRVTRTPYAQEPMDCLSAHSAVEEVVLMWGAQTSKTTIGSNWIGYLADINPGPVMIVQPTIDMAKRYSRQRLVPMIEESPVLRRKVRENRSRDEANTTLLKEFAGGFLAIAGANSAAGLRSMPVRDLFTDEEDGYPQDVDGEGDPVQLARARQTTFSRRKHLRTSTPTTRDCSRIEAAYLASDRCTYHVACPHCGTLQPLEWGADKAYGIKWSKHQDGTPDLTTVRYICQGGGCEIQEHHKPAMLLHQAMGGQARWVAANPGAQTGRVRGFQLSSLYSPLGWLSWATIVEEWHKAMEAARTGDPSLLRVFINTRLAQTYEDQGDRADQHALRKRAEDYPLRTVPHGGLVITAGVDTQGDRLEAYAYAWGRGEESWLVDHTVIYGDPGLPETEPGSPWARLTEWRRLPMTHATGATIGITSMAVDSGGHHSDLVYRYARRHAAEHVIAIKGSSQPGRPIIGKPSQVEFNHQGRRIKGGAQVWMLGTDTAKHLLFGRMAVTEPGPGYLHTSRHLPGYVWEQITAERLATRYVKGHAKREWVKPPGKRNEALDCAVYAMAAAWHIGVSRHTEHHWAKYQARLMQPDLLAPALTLDSPEATMATVAHISQGQPEDDGVQPEQAPEPQADGPATAHANATADPPAAPTQTAPAPTPQQSTHRPPQQRPTGRHVGRGGWVKRW